MILGIDEFKKESTVSKIGDLLLHYKNGHDLEYVKKAKIVKDELQELAATKEKLRMALGCLEFYSNEDNWLQHLNGRYRRKGSAIYYIDETMEGFLSADNGEIARETLKKIGELK